VRTEITERTSGGSPLLPSNTKEKDGQLKEELHKLMNGNSAGIDASTDRVCLLQCQLS
jgi:DNA mismatch repair protein MutH